MTAAKEKPVTDPAGLGGTPAAVLDELLRHADLYTDEQRRALYIRHAGLRRLDGQCELLTAHDLMRLMSNAGVSVRTYKARALHRDMRENRAEPRPDIRQTYEFWECSKKTFGEMCAVLQSREEESIVKYEVRRVSGRQWMARIYIKQFLINVGNFSRDMGCYVGDIDYNRNTHKQWVEFIQHVGDCRPSGWLFGGFADAFRPDPKSRGRWPQAISLRMPGNRPWG